MNYEKEYNEALKRAKRFYDSNTNEGYRQIFEEIFPELTENEDERIRKELIELVEEIRSTTYYGRCCYKEIPFKSILAWLEKQGEQTSDKIEPKFKIGDIIRFKGNETLKGEAETHKIVRYDNELYVFDDGTTDLFCEQDMYEIVEHKPVWSEEDEKMLNDTIQFIETGWTNKGKSHLISWLKSLKERYTWKPSDEQLKQLSKYCTDNRILTELYEQLKAL